MLKTKISILSFGFKYGIPCVNYCFDVSFVKNPARTPPWNFRSPVTDEMRHFVLEQPLCQKFITSIIPLVVVLNEIDDDIRIAFGCSSGRHRSLIIAEEITKQLSNLGIMVKLIHRENDNS
jgi:UPF0042 nucleotide-binding protein